MDVEETRKSPGICRGCRCVLLNDGYVQRDESYDSLMKRESEE